MIRVLLMLSISAPQEEAPDIFEAKYQCRKILEKAQPGTEVSIAGFDRKYRLLIFADSTGKASRIKRLLGRRVGGVPVDVLVAPKPRPKRGAARGKARAAPRPKMEAPRGGAKAAPSPKADVGEPCDFLRRVLKQPTRPGAEEPEVCHQMIGWTTSPARKSWARKNRLPTWQSREISLFFCYTYVRHRRECPFTLMPGPWVVEHLTPRIREGR